MTHMVIRLFVAPSDQTPKLPRRLPKSRPSGGEPTGAVESFSLLKTQTHPGWDRTTTIVRLRGLAQLLTESERVAKSHVGVKVSTSESRTCSKRFRGCYTMSK